MLTWSTFYTRVSVRVLSSTVSPTVTSFSPRKNPFPLSGDPNISGFSQPRSAISPADHVIRVGPSSPQALALQAESSQSQAPPGAHRSAQTSFHCVRLNILFVRRAQDSFSYRASAQLRYRVSQDERGKFEDVEFSHRGGELIMLSAPRGSPDGQDRYSEHEQCKFAPPVFP